MAKKTDQGELGIKTGTAKTGPVECLGMIFENDDARRKHFLDELRKKLQDPDFRKIEGFPIGEDEDILALSDPPYYTACPNPWLADFVKHYGKPYTSKDKYHREPFAADVSEGKTDPIYTAHSYHTKVPHKAIMRFILHYTDPGDVVLDGFSGTGMTGVAAGLCANQTSIADLGYRVTSDNNIVDQEGKTISKIGLRHAILSDICPAATQIAANYNAPVDSDDFRDTVRQILDEVNTECGWMFETTHREGSKKGAVNFTVWSDVFICPECAEEIVFFDVAVNKATKKVKKAFNCPACSVSLSKRGMDHATVTSFDTVLGTTVKQSKRVPVLINYSLGGQTYEKEPDAEDGTIIEKIRTSDIPYWFPSTRMLEGQETRRNDPIGLTHVHHFYTPRSLWILSALLSKTEKVESHRTRSMCRFIFEQWAIGFSLLNRYSPHHYSQNNRNLSGTLYVGSQIAEVSPSYALEGKLKRLVNTFQARHTYTGIIATQSSEALPLEDESVDYVFLDPPFGANLNYSELNFFWESWFRVTTNNKSEAIENEAQHKTREDYRTLMAACFKETYRVLKPGRWLSVEFSNTSSEIWNSIQTSLQEAGFVVANVAGLDKKQLGFKAVTTPTAVKQDLVISAYKPNGGLEERFKDECTTEVGVWDFVKTHLNNLPVAKTRGGQLEPVAERDPRILFDRTVAFYIRHGIPVPLSSPEFRAGLADRFPERDGMYFLPPQAAEYDTARMKVEGLGQMSIFVEDERSAVDWMRQFLKSKPSSYQDVTPAFLQALAESWKKWETRPELRALLDQYFLCYHGEDTVPPQIHSYLSTDFKDLRNLKPDDPALRAKAKDRWYVPDPKNQVQVEQMREKHLLEEFWTYLPPGMDADRLKHWQDDRTQTLPGMEAQLPKIPKGKRLKIVRTEAVRVGFSHCSQVKNYLPIVAVARYIPEDVVSNDDQLQMIVDLAEMRLGL